VCTGTLVLATVEYMRTAQHRRHHQHECHRTPRYRVRYQLEGHPTHEALVGPNPRRYLVADIRESKPGDIVEVTLTEDRDGIVDWINKTNEEFWMDATEYWGKDATEATGRATGPPRAGIC